MLSEFFKSVREEWPVISQAPRTFTISLLLLTSICGGILYLGFRENLTRKNDLIQTLQAQVEALKRGTGKSGDSSKQSPPSTGPATANGSGGVANTGSGNTFSTGQPPAAVKTEKK
jgi:hypothetical protein